MRSALTAGFVSGEPGRQAARGGLRALGVDPMRQDSAAALRDVAGGLLADADDPRRRGAAGRGRRACHASSDLMATLESLGSGCCVHRTAPGATSPTSAAGPRTAARTARRCGCVAAT